jgi:hypothetical protein
MQVGLAAHWFELDHIWRPLLRTSCWQLLYVIGSVVGYRRCIGAPSLLAKNRFIVPVSAGIALVLLVTWQVSRFSTTGLFSLAGAQGWWIEKRSLGPLRVFDFLALLAVVSYAAQKLAATIEKLRLCRGFAYLGQHSIYVFAWSMVTSYLSFHFRDQLAALSAPEQIACALLIALSLWVPAAIHGQCQKFIRNGNGATLWRSLEDAHLVPRKPLKTLLNAVGILD